MMEATKGIGQKSIKGGTKDFLIFVSWFVFKKAAEATLEVDAKFIGMLKTNTKRLCKESIEKLINYWPGDSYLVLRRKHMEPGDRPLISIGYNYNALKVLSFIVTYNTGITKTIISYLSKYTDQFSNVAICPISRPLVMAKIIFCC